MIKYTSCPICNAGCIREDLVVKDYTVSNKNFDVWTCDNCDLKYTDNVPDQSAIGKFYQSSNYISHSDTKVGFINKMYHKVRNHTLKTKRKLVEKFSNTTNGKILDIGCGTGAFLNNIQQAGWQIIGLEPDANAIKTANSLYKISPKTPEELFSLPANSFDAITMWHVLEHVHQLQEYIEQLKNLIKPQGAIFIAVPNYQSLDAEFYCAHWAAYDVPRHLYHFSPKSMEHLVSLHGLKIKAHKPMWFDSFYVSMLSEKYKSKKNKNNFIRAFIIGLFSNLSALFNTKKCSSIIYIIEKA
jgi:2-polyprenyl-3-methyl-5-hydroxy-6-metoxy-1,4-benzoquinol methylase